MTNRNTTIISVSLDKDVDRLLREIRWEHRTSMSRIINRALREYLNMPEPYDISREEAEEDAVRGYLQNHH